MSSFQQILQGMLKGQKGISFEKTKQASGTDSDKMENVGSSDWVFKIPANDILRL